MGGHQPWGVTALMQDEHRDTFQLPGFQRQANGFTRSRAAQ
jgi:hypothetical protein